MLIAIRVLQILAALCGLLSIGNGASFGARLYGADPVDWTQILYALGPAVGGAISWAASHWLGWKISTPAATELIAALAGWLPGLIAAKEDLVARRRVIVALFSVIESVNGWDELVRVRTAMGTEAEPPVVEVPRRGPR